MGGQLSLPHLIYEQLQNVLTDTLARVVYQNLIFCNKKPRFLEIIFLHQYVYHGTFVRDDAWQYTSGAHTRAR